MKLIAIFFLTSLILLATGCNADKKDNRVSLKMNSLMRIHCIGHSFIDLPEGFSLKSGSRLIFTPDQKEIEDGNIDLVIRPSTNKAAFEQQVQERHLTLANSEDMASTLSQEKDVEKVGKLFRVKIIDEAYQSEIHWLLYGNYLIARIKSYDNQVEKSEAVLLDFVRNVRDDSAVPDLLNSFCLDGVRVAGQYRSEFASLYFTSHATPDITFSADINTYQKDDAETLLQRVGGVNSLLRKFDAKESVLRKSELKAAGMRAQEWGASVLLGEDRKEKQVAFTLETMRPVPGPSAPKIHLEMEVKGASTQNEAGLLTLWDSVTKSLRQR